MFSLFFDRRGKGGKERWRVDGGSVFVLVCTYECICVCVVGMKAAVVGLGVGGERGR